MSTRTGQKGCAGGAPLVKCAECGETFVVNEAEPTALCPDCEEAMMAEAQDAPADVCDFLGSRGHW